MTFYLSLLALGLAGATGAVAIRVLADAQAKRRQLLRLVPIDRVDRTDRRTGRDAWRG